MSEEDTPFTPAESRAFTMGEQSGLDLAVGALVEYASRLTASGLDSHARQVFDCVRVIRNLAVDDDPETPAAS